MTSFTVTSVLILLVQFTCFAHLLIVDPAIVERDLFEAGDLTVLMLVSTGLTKFVASTRDSCVPVSSHVNPCPRSVTSRFPFSEIIPVQIGDLQLSARTRFDLFRVLYNMIIIEIQSGHRIV